MVVKMIMYFLLLKYNLTVLQTIILRMMSATGQCQAFCDTADGYARGEGCGIVILKPLKQVRDIIIIINFIITDFNPSLTYQL